MRLYTSPSSPFGARVEIALKAKGLTIDHSSLPAQGLSSPEFLAINPIAKIPVLVTPNGTAIPESAEIMNYIEDLHPAPPLRPADPDERARMNLLVKVVDAYVMAPVIRLFPHLNPATRDDDAIARERAYWAEGLRALAHFMAPPMPQSEIGLTLADCVLPPSLHLGTRIAALLDLADPAAGMPILGDYCARMKEHQIVGPILAELTASQARMDAKAGRQSVAQAHG